MLQSYAFLRLKKLFCDKNKEYHNPYLIRKRHISSSNVTNKLETIDRLNCIKIIH
jgi:transcription elongation factor